jgi:hypothetical protein
MGRACTAKSQSKATVHLAHLLWLLFKPTPKTASRQLHKLAHQQTIGVPAKLSLVTSLQRRIDCRQPHPNLIENASQKNKDRPAMCKVSCQATTQNQRLIAHFAIAACFVAHGHSEKCLVIN